ncbi:hypothetical protein C3492_10610 [Streptomyces sp. Ru62]|uniref:GHMP family kinase ATP-binding protein n=1 Tax=Streptomyces sp. Ru62 TaxID=2080745 RepID=UPI000CDD0EB6|nr:hypothetical protein [Streptomyces sp. Ru62]POX63585.1 hypothetical protein C3492_10610 [Streptomyces sp. Ru62]
MTTVLSRAPMRISIAGGGTDLPEYYRHGPTTVVAAAVTHRVHVCVADRPARALAVLNAQGADWHHLSPPNRSAHHPYPAAAAAVLGLTSLPSIAVGSPVPPGSGLGGSGAYCVALVDALARWSGRPLDPDQVAALAFRLEREVLGRTVGQQDAWAAALGGTPRIHLAPDGSVTATHSPDLFTALTRLIDTGLMLYRIPGTRDASRVLAAAPEVTPARHRRAVAAAALTEQAFLSGDITEVGATLRAHWARKVAANPAADHPVCRRLTQATRADGISGFKLIGAGGGGHLLIAADPARTDRARAFLESLALTRVPLRVSRKGLDGTVLTEEASRAEGDPCASA